MIPIECNTNNPTTFGVVGPATEKSTCCWGVFRTNVEQGAVVVAFIGIMFSLLSALIFFLPVDDVHDPLAGVVALLYLFPCICILLALHRRDPRLYLPYLTYGVIEIVFSASELFVSVLFTLNPPEEKVQQLLKERSDEFKTAEQARKVYRLTQGGEAAVLLLEVCVAIWFYWVVFKAYKAMRRRRFPPAQRLSELPTNY